MVDPRVYEVMSKPIVSHLDPFLFEVMAEISAWLKPVFGTANEFTLAVSGTGTAGMEAAVSNFVEPGSKFAVFTNGYFCDRIAEMGRRHGANTVELKAEWGNVYDPDQARDFIKREKPNVVAFVHAETSTGAFNDPGPICEAAREVGAFVIADCVTSLGTMPINLDAVGIDCAYSGTQKGLGAPPGLSPITVSPKAMEWIKNRKSVNPSWYFDFNLLSGYFGTTRRYHHTAPITMFYALREALALLHDEGLEPRLERHRRNQRAFVAGAEAMGLKMRVAAPHRLMALNTPEVPEGIDDLKARKHMLNNYNIEISGGLGSLLGKVFRIGVMGVSSTKENVLLVLETLEEALREQGYKAPASGKAAAEKTYA